MELNVCIVEDGLIGRANQIKELSLVEIQGEEEKNRPDHTD